MPFCYKWLLVTAGLVIRDLTEVQFRWVDRVCGKWVYHIASHMVHVGCSLWYQTAVCCEPSWWPILLYVWKLQLPNEGDEVCPAAIVRRELVPSCSKPRLPSTYYRLTEQFFEVVSQWQQQRTDTQTCPVRLHSSGLSNVGTCEVDSVFQGIILSCHTAGSIPQYLSQLQQSWLGQLQPWQLLAV